MLRLLRQLEEKTLILTTTLQFGLVHHFTKLGSGEYYLEELEHEVGVLLRYWVSGTGLGSGYCTATVSQNNTEVQKFKILCVCGPFDPWTLSARRAHIWHKVKAPDTGAFSQNTLLDSRPYGMNWGLRYLLAYLLTY